MTRLYIAELELRWILNYRTNVPIEKRLCSKYQGLNSIFFDTSPEVQYIYDLDYHTEDTFNWTKNQSNQIDLIGWDQWFQEKGSEGYILL